MLEGPVMPTTLYNEMDEPGLEDQRTLQLALKLSMLSMNNTASSDGSSSPDCIVETGLTTLITNVQDEPRTRKSQNMTECVPVPSSEHVAEIVGRQGCKIKALRAKTNTYIKTPVRGEEPVFVVTGRKEDVAAAKKEILSAADHFSQIRAQRKGGGSPTNNVGVPPGPPHVPGQVTRPVRVPYKVVGLVVGPKGATIKRIQQQTHTYIVTPSRDREPVFEVTGLPDNVELAKKEIENHIAFRTGGLSEEEFSRPNGLMSTFSIDSSYTPNDGSSCSSSASSSTGSSSFLDNIPGYYAPQKMGDFNNGYTCLFPDDAAHAIWSADVESTAAKNGWEYNPYGRGVSSLLGTIRSGRYSPDGHPPARRFNSDPLGSGMISSGSEHSPSASTGSPSPPLAPTTITAKRNCMVCFDSPVMAALIPCGHNLFCMECAQGICKTEGACPVCQQPGHQAIRIINSQN